MRLLRVYADTSVFGGPFDDEFCEASASFFEQVRWGRFELVGSITVRNEIKSAPQEVQNLFQELLPLMEIVDLSRQAVVLRQAYLDARIVTPKSATDALHVALATIAKCSVIVSWNFKDIVHFDKIPLYNAVNTLGGYPSIAIYSPLEVIDYEKDEEV